MLHGRADHMRIQDPANKIPREEPVVLLRAQDSYAAQALRGYILLMEKDGQVDPALIQAMKDHLVKFAAWPKRKIPDLPREQAPRQVQSGFPE